MARRVAVLCTEGRSESIDSAEGRGSKLTLELAAHGEVGLRSKEVLGVVHLSRLGDTVEVERRHLEHVARALAVAGRHDRRVEIVESMIVEVLMDGDGHVVADAEDGAKGVGAQAQMGILAHVLEALTLLLQGVGGRAKTIDLDLLTLDLAGLPLALTLHERADHAEAGSRGDALERLGIHRGRIYHHLDVVDRRAIVEGNEIYGLAAAMRAHPALHIYVFSEVGTLECIDHFCSFHLLCCLKIVALYIPIPQFSTERW